MGGSGLFTTRNAEEYIFGYNKPDFIVFAKSKGLVNFPGLVGPNTTTVPVAPPATYKGPITVYTGADGDHSRIGFYKKYYGVASITTVVDLPPDNKTCPLFPPRNSYESGCAVWSTQSSPDGLISGAEVITGTSDGLKAPFLFQEDSSAIDMIVWVPEAQRRIRFMKTSDVTFKDVKLWRYTMDPNTLRNSTDPLNTNPAMARHYYMVNVPRGVASLQRANAFDLFLSTPHFYGGDIEFHKRQIDFGNDLQPNIDHHGTYLDVEPLTGRTFAARKRLQFGMYLSSARITDVTFGGIYAGIVQNYPGNNGTVEAMTTNNPGSCKRNLYLPILWGAEGKDIPDNDASSFVDKIYGTRKTFMVVQIVLVIVGGIMFFTFLILCIKASKASTTSM